MRVAKLRMSDNFQQAMFTGGGLSYADTLLKDPEKGPRYQLETDEMYEADYTGFECRWNAIPSPYDETLSLIVNVIDPDNARRILRYQDIIHWIDGQYGDSQQRHPIDTSRMSLILNPFKFNVETRIRDRTANFRRLLRLAWVTMKGRIAIWFKIGKWGEYKNYVVEATDNEKFDDTLRMIISGTRQQGVALRNYLEALHAQGILAYGIHSSSHCLMTCIVFDHFGRQVHFIDGANGGYALAALQMKEQLKALGQLG
jgi:tRNA A37 N6-isopentenylltransferase MiaA